jgi:excisionase family DNA binding protein
MDEILTVKQSAIELKIPERTLYQLIKDKKGPKAFRVSKRQIRLYRSDLKIWIEANEI